MQQDSTGCTAGYEVAWTFSSDLKRNDDYTAPEERPIGHVHAPRQTSRTQPHPLYFRDKRRLMNVIRYISELDAGRTRAVFLYFFMLPFVLPLLTAGVGTGIPPVAAQGGAAAAYDGSRPVRIVGMYGPTSLHVGEAANFRARRNDGAATPVVYRWKMGDGTRAEGNNVAHRYKRPGQFRIVATARNSKGSDSDTLWVTVSEPPAPVAPAATLTIDLNDGDSAEDGEPDVRASTSNAPRPAPFTPLRGREPIHWQEGGFTLMAVTRFDQASAESSARRYRNLGLRTGIYVDEGVGSPAYRVVVGQFKTEEQAAAARRTLLGEGWKGAFLVESLPSQTGK